MSLFKKIDLAVAAGLSVVMTLIIVSLVLAIPVNLLWNWLMPQIFGLKVITIWQAWGLNLLAGILIRGHKK